MINYVGITYAADELIPQQQVQDQQLVMNMPNLDIRSLIQWAVDTLGKNIIVHQSVQGTVTILTDNPLSQDEAWQVFLTALQVNGFTAVETGDVIRIIPESDALKAAIPVIDGDTDPDGAEMVIKLVKVNNISASQLSTLLAPLIPQVGLISVFEPGNTIIIAGYASNVSRIENIIQSMDQASELDVEIIPLLNANARQVVDTLNSLINPAGTLPGQPITFAVDERSNSILMTGDVAKRRQIRVVVSGLDQPLAGEGNTHVHYVHYLSATDLVPILQAVVASIIEEQGNGSSTAVTTSIQASDTANALIITAPPAIYTAIEDIIAQLDIRRAQVLVEAIIIEVNQDKIDDLGVLWSTSANNAAETGIIGSAATVSSTLTDALTRTGNDADVSLFGNGLTLGYYRGGSLRGMLRALSTDAAVNVLSTPSIVTLDNEEAEIIVGSNVPFLTGSRETSGTANLFNTIERRDIGVSLRIKPQINDGDSVTLEINQTVESVIDRDEAADIQTDKREITTKVIIHDNDILVLGGLIKDGSNDAELKIPFLGDIPLAGRLFRSNKSITEKKNLMVFIHAYILKDQISENEVSRNRYNFIRDQQIEFGEDVREFRKNNSEDAPLLPEFELFRVNAAPVPITE
jgi:general secretion pathway protein D